MKMNRRSILSSKREIIAVTDRSFKMILWKVCWVLNKSNPKCAWINHSYADGGRNSVNEISSSSIYHEVCSVSFMRHLSHRRNHFVICYATINHHAVFPFTFFSLTNLLFFAFDALGSSWWNKWVSEESSLTAIQAQISSTVTHLFGLRFGLSFRFFCNDYWSDHSLWFTSGSTLRKFVKVYEWSHNHLKKQHWNDQMEMMVATYLAVFFPDFFGDEAAAAEIASFSALLLGGLPLFLSDITFTTTTGFPLESSFGGLPRPLFTIPSPTTALSLIFLQFLKYDLLFTWWKSRLLLIHSVIVVYAELLTAMEPKIKFIQVFQVQEYTGIWLIYRKQAVRFNFPLTVMWCTCNLYSTVG